MVRFFSNYFPSTGNSCRRCREFEAAPNQFITSWCQGVIYVQPKVINVFSRIVQFKFNCNFIVIHQYHRATVLQPLVYHTAGQLLNNTWSTIDTKLVNYWLTVAQLSDNNCPTIGRQLTNCWQTVKSQINTTVLLQKSLKPQALRVNASIHQLLASLIVSGILISSPSMSLVSVIWQPSRDVGVRPKDRSNMSRSSSFISSGNLKINKYK